MVKKIAIILGSFHQREMAIMLSEAQKTAAEHSLEIVKEVWVPGSFEKPLALKKVFTELDVDAAVILGIIERGETKHGLVMGQSVTTAIIDLQLEFMKPVGMGVLGPEILPDQIEPRLVPYARAAVEALAKLEIDF